MQHSEVRSADPTGLPRASPFIRYLEHTVNTLSASYPYNLYNRNTAPVPVPNMASAVSSPPPQMPMPEKPTPLPPEMPQPAQPIGEPSPMENPIPMREPPATLPPQS